jgi:hypothetical protein
MPCSWRSDLIEFFVLSPLALNHEYLTLQGVEAFNTDPVPIQMLPLHLCSSLLHKSTGSSRDGNGARLFTMGYKLETNTEMVRVVDP